MGEVKRWIGTTELILENCITSLHVYWGVCVLESVYPLPHATSNRKTNRQTCRRWRITTNTAFLSVTMQHHNFISAAVDYTSGSCTWIGKLVALCALLWCFLSGASPPSPCKWHAQFSVIFFAKRKFIIHTEKLADGHSGSHLKPLVNFISYSSANHTPL